MGFIVTFIHCTLEIFTPLLVFHISPTLPPPFIYSTFSFHAIFLLT